MLGLALFTLLYQTSARHSIDIGGFDTAYVQGFHEAQSDASIYLLGSDGQARWSRERSFLIFPQAGLPASVTLRLRGWRPSEPPPQVRILLNSKVILAEFQTTGQWEERQLPLNAGLGKANDVVLEIQATPTTRLPDDGREVGILLDHVVYQVKPAQNGLILPYPAQILYGAWLTLLLWLYPQPPTTIRQLYVRLFLLLSVGLIFLCCYRLQPPLYPYPLRWFLPGLNCFLLALMLIKHGPKLLEYYPKLPDLIALVGISLWTGAILLVAQHHVTLSVPGVEKDFRVFATRTGNLTEVLRADGFYNLGYPLLLWLGQKFTENNAFLAAKFIAALSGTLLLSTSYWLSSRLFSNLLALLTLLILAFNPLIIEYALYVGSDLPFAAFTLLSITLLIRNQQQISKTHLVLAGLTGGLAFLIRHSGFLILFWGLLYLLFFQDKAKIKPLLWFTFGFFLAAMPQLSINTLQMGQPFYNQQAKNIWLAVYGNTDWGRWGEVPDSIALPELMLRDPVRFLANWGRNMVAFGGSGAEDTSQFGQALQLRLLGWPANWLAILGILGWLFQLRNWKTAVAREAKDLKIQSGILLFSLLFVGISSLAFLLPRFLLSLAPLYAIAATWLISQAAKKLVQRANERIIIVWLGLLLCQNGNFATATQFVLTQQPPAEVAAVDLVLKTLPPRTSFFVQTRPNVPLAKYSALAHRAIPWAAAASLLQQNQRLPTNYLLWDDSFGPPMLPNQICKRIGFTAKYSLCELIPNSK